MRDVSRQSSQVWLAQLRASDQNHAPDLPPNMDANSLSVLEIRNLVVKAARGYDKKSRLSKLAPSRRRCLPMKGIYGKTTLLPGGRFLLMVRRPANLQMWDIRKPDGGAATCVWSNKNTNGVEILGYEFDMQENGDIIFCVVWHGLSFRIFRFISGLGCVKEEPQPLRRLPWGGNFHGMKLLGNVLAFVGSSEIMVIDQNSGKYVRISTVSKNESLIRE